MLSKYISKTQRNWDEYLPLLLLAYRSSVHESTGQTPYMMMFGRHALLPTDLVCIPPGSELQMTSHAYLQTLHQRLRNIHEISRNEMPLASDRQMKKYDHRVNIIPFRKGDLVWLHLLAKTKGHHPKLQPRWEGPYEIK